MALLSARKMAQAHPGFGERNFIKWAKLKQDPLPSYQLGRGLAFDPDELMPWVRRHPEIFNPGVQRIRR